MSKKAAIRTVRKVDVNGDGVVDRFEFRAIMVNFICRKKYVTRVQCLAVLFPAHVQNTHTQESRHFSIVQL